MLTEYKVHGDAFLGFIDEGYQDISREMLVHMQGDASDLFQPRKVRAYDPSEIIFYTEMTAFPAYYLSELSDLRRHYEALLNDTKSVTPLHIDQDYHQFQPLMPFNQAQLASYKHAWHLFIQAQMLGLIRSLRLRAEDDVRLIYQWRRKVGAFDVQWNELGAEGRAIERLMLAPDLRARLQADIVSEKERFLATPEGSLYYLIALADYYSYCIFPVRKVPGAGQGMTIPLGSMQNLVCNELRAEWRTEQRRNVPEDKQSDEEVKRVLGDLAIWSKPVYRDPRQLVPATSEIPDAERLDEWGLSGAAAEAIRTFVAHGLLPQTRDRLGSLILRFPRLAIDWAYFENEDQVRGTAPSAAWYYRGDGGQEQGLSAREVADRVEHKPDETHKVWAKGLDNWRNAREVPEIARLLAASPPPASTVQPAEEKPVPPPLPRAARPEDEEMPPPLSGGEDPGPLFHYACDAETVGKLPAGEIASRVAASPDRVHRVWTKTFGSSWRPAVEVPEIASRLPDLPPSLA
jgi:hypothetical protein